MKAQTNFDLMERSANDLNMASDEYKSLSTQLASTARDLKQIWGGDDNVAFLNQIEPLENDLNNMSKQLNICSIALRKQKEIYQSHIEAGVNAANRLPHS